MSLRVAFTLFFPVWAAIVGCSPDPARGDAGRADAGGTDAGGADAALTGGGFDECGNGVDDDADGVIDDGCPCGLGESQACFTGAHRYRGVGACADGTQACEVEAAMEFGGWGACASDRAPGEQLCDGNDGDCDGTIDEGCSSCSPGETRDCGREFTTPPCRTGTQTCAADGTWSACEGAIWPSAEICTDAIDNDCDGVVNERCGCVPTPEICADGIDNDCDGFVDEPACAGGYDAGIAADAGAPTGDCSTDLECGAGQVCVENSCEPG